MSGKAPTPTTGRVHSKHLSPSTSTQQSLPSTEEPHPIRASSSTIVQRARLDARSLTPNEVLHLQRTIGNHAVNNLLKGARPAPPRPVTVAPASTIQRVVKTKVYPLREKGKSKKVYYSSFDTETEFDDLDDAWEYDKKLAKKQESFIYKQRVATNFSYYQTKSQNVVPDLGRAGPHSLSHSSLAFRLNKRFQDKSTDLTALRDEQVLTKKEFKQALDDEKPTTLNPFQELRMIEDYSILYDKLDDLLQVEEPSDLIRNAIYEYMMRLMQMNPYTVYGKKTGGRKMGKKAMGYKNEKEDDHFSDAFDQGAKFRKEEGYQGYQKKRKRLYDSENEDEGEEKDEDKGEPKTKKRKVNEKKEDEEL